MFFFKSFFLFFKLLIFNVCFQSCLLCVLLYVCGGSVVCTHVRLHNKYKYIALNHNDVTMLLLTSSLHCICCKQTHFTARQVIFRPVVFHYGQLYYLTLIVLYRWFGGIHRRSVQGSTHLPGQQGWYLFGVLLPHGSRRIQD